jgi:hypothetical protein
MIYYVALPFVKHEDNSVPGQAVASTESTESMGELRGRYHAWCIDRLMEDRLDCCKVPEEFHVLCERRSDV